MSETSTFSEGGDEDVPEDAGGRGGEDRHVGDGGGGQEASAGNGAGKGTANRQRYIQIRQERRRNKDRATATAIGYTHKALEKKSATKVRSLSGRDSWIYGI